MIRTPKADRRKVNVPTGDERRGRGKDRRRCPQCGSSILQNAEPMPGGTRTRLFCTKCDWQAESRQVDEEKMKAMLGFEAMVVGTVKKPLLELSPEYLKAAGVKPGDNMELNPVYAPGGEKILSWVLKKIEG